MITIEVPPLRERGGDVLLLAEHFLKNCVAKSGRRDVVGFSTSAKERLRGHAWPGNVRELQNCVERAVALAPGPWIEAADLRFVPTPPLGTVLRVGSATDAPKVAADATLEGALAKKVVEALTAAGGNTRAAAEFLRISRGRLLRLMERLGLKPSSRR